MPPRCLPTRHQPAQPARHRCRAGPAPALLHRQRPIEAVPTPQWPEPSAGRDLFRGFGVDIGDQHAQNANEEGVRSRTNGIVSRIGFQRGFQLPLTDM